MNAVPRGSGRRYGRGIVDRRARKQAETVVGHAEHTAERRESQRRDDIEQENDRNRLCNLLIVRTDDRSGCRDGRAAADGRADTDQRRDVRRHLHRLAQHERYDQRGADGRNDDGQRLCADLCNLGQVKTEAEQDDCVLQHLFRREADTWLHLGLVLPEQREHHADQDGEHRSADNRHRLSQQPRRNRNAQAQQQSSAVFLNEIHYFTPFINRIIVYTISASQFNTQFVQRAKEISPQAICRLIGPV